MSNEQTQIAFDWWNNLREEVREELVLKMYCLKNNVRME